MGQIRVGLVGIGNCASSLVQGLTHYADARTDGVIPGVMHPDLGGWRIGDIAIASAFDVAEGKVGRDVSDAILGAPNNTHVFARPPSTGVIVARGPTLDGVGQYTRDVIVESGERPVEVARHLRRTETEVVVSYLPVGSEQAARFYAEAALEAGCAFVNCMPAFIASDGAWRERFARARLPIIGDDIKSQVGATIVHRMLANLFRERGVRIDRTYQLNFGGNADFMNMLERDRLVSKKISKTRAVTSQFAPDAGDVGVHVGPSDYVEWLSDRKWAYIRVEGTTFGDVPIACELKLEVWDSPNSAGVVVDAIRCAKLGLERGLGGALIGPCSYFMKSPPQQFDDHLARERTEAFIAGDYG